MIKLLPDPLADLRKDLFADPIRALNCESGLTDVGSAFSAFRGPAVVVSVDILNNSPGRTSFARCDQLRVISTARLASRRGMIAPDQMSAIDQALRFVLDL